MTGIYYVEAADWLRSIGITVVEVSGWQTRARSSGGFASAPLGIQWHHTASQTTPKNDTDWQYFGSSDRPIGNMTIMRDGSVWIGAAGAANTAGKGGPLTMSRGTIPVDGANSRTWAFEVANNGVGEAWPQVQIDSYFACSNELNRRFGNQPTDVFSHAVGTGNGWTNRKIDPATAAAVQGPWKPRSVNSSGTWNLDDIRAECARRATNTPHPPEPTPPDTGDTDMTDEEHKALMRLHDAMFNDDAVMAGYPSIWTMTNQTRSAVITFWDGFPGNIKDGAGVLARTIKNIAAKTGAKVG